MTFDANAFNKAKFKPRTAQVKVDSLKDFFDGDPVWEVRGLTANEIAKANEAEEKNKNMSTIVDVLDSVDGSDKVKELRQSLGLTSDSHPETVKRLEQFVVASVNPEITLDVAVKIATVYPVEFYLLTNKIVELTGQGQLLEKK